MKTGEEYFSGSVSLKAIIASPTGRVLICRNHEEADIWDLPGGTLNLGEKPVEGLVREIHEELGITPHIGAPVVADIFIRQSSGKQIFVLLYSATLDTEQTDFIFDETEIAEAKWISKEDLAHIKLFPEYHRALEEFFSR